MAVCKNSLRFVSSRLSLALVLSLTVTSSDALPSLSPSNGQISHYPFKKVIGLWKDLDSSTCRCVGRSQACEVEIAETAVVRTRGLPCPVPTRYCCQRKDSTDLVQSNAGLGDRIKLPLHRPKRSGEPVPSSGEPKKVLAPFASLPPVPAEPAWHPHRGPEDGSLKYLHSQLDLYLTNGVPTSNVVVKTDDEAFISDKQDRFEAFMYEDAIANTKNAIAIDSEDFEYYSAGVRDDSAVPSKLSACSCTTPEECVRMWSPELSMLPIDIRTTLKCDGLHDIVCCFGRIIPPRENRAKAPAIQQQHQNAQKPASGLWSNLWNYAMSWLN